MAIIEIERKTNVLALTSFLLSLIAIGHQFYGYLRGAKVELFAPSVVVLSTYDHGRSGHPERYLSIEANMTYVNRGQLGHNDVLRLEAVEFVGPGGKDVRLTWMEFLEGSAADPADPDRKIEAAVKPAGPRVIAARDAISHETRFVAFNEECPDSKDSECARRNYLLFNEGLVRFFARQSDPIELKFSAKLYGSEAVLRSGCRVFPAHIDVESFLRRRWISLNCYPSIGGRSA